MLCWNVYMSDFNKREIKVVNIFDHGSFYGECVRAKKKFKDDKEGFAKEVKGWLHYFFWAKCEYEIILDHWPDGEWGDLRKRMKVSELIEMYKQAGLKYESWRINENVMDREVTVKVFPEWNKFYEEKIDICQQVMNNWDIFIDYLWDHRSELKVRKSK